MAKDKWRDKTSSNINTEMVDKDTSRIFLEDMFLEFLELMVMGKCRYKIRSNRDID